jgi:hypothetical protein
MTNFTTPTGRLVFGNPFTAQVKKDDDQKPVLDKVTGQPVMEFTVGVAFAKSDPATTAFLAELRVADRAAWPQYFDAAGNRTAVAFADKIKDGDGLDRKGRPYSRKDGWAGHWIISFMSQYAPGVFAHDGRQWAQITTGVKPGDYVRVSGTTTSNMQTAASRTAGMYRNLNMVGKVGDGAPIVVGADANEVFGAAPPPLPPGATTVPQAPGVPLPLAAPPPAPADPKALAIADGWIIHPSAVGHYYKGQEVLPAADVLAKYATAPPPPPAPPAAPPAPPPAPAAPPYDGYMGAPPPAPAALPPPPPAPARVMLPAANGATYDQLVAAGWTDALLVQHGMMAG